METCEYHWITPMSKNGCTSLHSHQHYTVIFPISLHPHQILVTSCRSDYSHADECEVICHCGFDL